MVSFVSFRRKTRDFVVEEKPGGDDDAELTAASLRLRVRQQEILAELGVLALRGTPFTELLDHTARLAAEGLNAAFGKILEYLPAENRFLVRAGVGWDLGDAMPGCEIHVDAPRGIEIATDRAIPIALLVNELVTNASKYAYPSGNGRAWVTLSRATDDAIVVSVRDEGAGLPADFDIKSGKRLGMRLINAFTKQLAAELDVQRRAPGTEFVLSVPAAG